MSKYLLFPTSAVFGGLLAWRDERINTAIRKSEIWWHASDGIAYCLRKYFDAELAHSIAIKSMKFGLNPIYNEEKKKIISSKCLGLEFESPIGVAAGFDKEAQVYKHLGEMGWGFVEVGGVTPRAQAGNAKPRIFRLPEDYALINRVGLPSDGVDAIQHRFQKVNIPIGVNCAKCHDGDPVHDMAQVIQKLQDTCVDFFVLNASCPNVKGGIVANIQELRQAIRQAKKQNIQKKPILVKISPDLNNSDLKAISKLALTERVDGLILANTTKRREQDLVQLQNKITSKQIGGLSGKPLFQNTHRIVSFVYKETRGSIPIIAVGGIFTAEDALKLILAGASLLQLYTGLIYNPPTTSRHLHNELACLLQAQGFNSLYDAIGANHRP